ncbi:hypothetical protein [Cohnella endophytica]|nr:hypothetical protein [Cohnella endophytica]
MNLILGAIGAISGNRLKGSRIFVGDYLDRFCEITIKNGVHDFHV